MRAKIQALIDLCVRIDEEAQVLEIENSTASKEVDRALDGIIDATEHFTKAKRAIRKLS